MKSNDLIFIGFVVLFSLTFLYLDFYEIRKEFKNNTSIIINNSQECLPNQTISCKNSKNCSGFRICRDGKWSECIVNKICIPGKVYKCYIDECTPGNKTCNECGTGYSECK